MFYKNKTMDLIKYANQQALSNEKFLSELETLKADYQEAAKGQQKLMFLVGKINKYKNHYSRQSSEWKFYQAILDELNVNSDMSTNYTRAYNYYLKILSHEVEEYTEIANNATPYQLLALKGGEHKTTLYDAVKYYKSNKRLPSVSLIKARNADRVNSKFESFSLKPAPEPKPKTEPAPAPSPVIQQVSDKQDKVKQCLEDESLTHIDSHLTAQCYLTGGRMDKCKAFLQMLKEIDTASPQLMDMLLSISSESRKAWNRANENSPNPLRR